MWGYLDGQEARSDEGVLNLLRQIELGLGFDSSVKTAFRSAGISDATYYN